MRISVVVFLLFTILVFLIPLTAIRHYTPVAPVVPVDSPGSSAVQVPADQGSSSSEGQGSSAVLDEPEEYEINIPEVASFNILNESTGKVEAISVRDYVRGAVAAELPATFHIEAMRAQAVCAHTFALYRHMLALESPDPELNGADFSADPDNRKGYATESSMRKFYGDMADVYWAKICEAADSVLNTYLLYEGEPIFAAYHSASGGITEGAGNVWMTALPYLVPVESEGDLLSPALESSVTFSSAELAQILSDAFEDLELPGDKNSWLSVLERSDSGYVTLIDVGNLTLHGRDLRTALDLRSTNFSITYKDNAFTFDCLGYGHGVGLSQYGADYMARQGADYREILAHYFNGITVYDAQ